MRADILTIAAAAAIWFASMMLLNGCSARDPEKVVVTKYKIVQASCPRLDTYKLPKPLKLTVTSYGNNVCIKEWNDSCLPSERFIELLNYTHDLKQTAEFYRYEIDQYNKKFTENNTSY